MSVVLALKGKVLTAGFAHIWPKFVFIFMPRQRQLVVEGLGAVFTVHYTVGMAVVVFQFLSCVHSNLAHAATIFL